MSSVQVRNVQALLNRHGFPAGPQDGQLGPLTAKGLRAFQAAYAGGRHGTPLLAIDGVIGPLSIEALESLPLLSAHFSTLELASRGNGHCLVSRRLVLALEALRRADQNRGLPILGAYRDPVHNARVGGARASMHLYGLAADLGRTVDVGVARGAGLFSGIGTRRGRASHVDLRHLAGAANKTPGATPSAPVTWRYD